jgi:hypothetical protein
LGSTVASQQIILIKKSVYLSSPLCASSFFNLKKQLSLSSLIQSSSFLNLKEDADKREKKDGERE